MYKVVQFQKGNFELLINKKSQIFEKYFKHPLQNRKKRLKKITVQLKLCGLG